MPFQDKNVHAKVFYLLIKIGKMQDSLIKSKLLLLKEIGLIELSPQFLVGLMKKYKIMLMLV